MFDQQRNKNLRSRIHAARHFCPDFILKSVLIGLVLGVTDTTAIAQIVPDNTLGNERSRLTPNDVIDGGATRGVNLFHSFSEFNVGKGQRVYFANPNGIERILGRITGNSRSEILGTLGVLGNADLFLINPNGIVFGANAKLDIQGSFVASTASTLKFPDGSEFSATKPQAAPLLKVNLTPGLQYGSSRQGATIANAGNLSVGQDLTLIADKLDLQGQLQAGRDLTMQATDTVRVRDSLTLPFLAHSGRDLTIQGDRAIDILALNHLPQSAFVSGGNLTVISDGQISTDAHFTNGGDFAIRTRSGNPGNFVSLRDPVFTVGGDYNVGDYTGASLQVSAGGNIDYGTVVINGIDPAVHPTNPALFLTAGGRITGTGSVSTTVPGIGFIVNFQSQGDISIQGVTTQGGSITLNSTAGSITTNEFPLYTTNVLGVEDGGTITLSAYSNINTGLLNTSSCASLNFCNTSDSATGNGGAINLTALNGSITTGNLSSYAYAYSSAAGNGGAINLTALNGNITTGFIFATSDSDFASTSNGGAVNLTASGDITTRDLYSASTSDFAGPAGNGGQIQLKTNGNIVTEELNASSSSSESSAKGGRIYLEANGNITTGNLNASSNGNANFSPSLNASTAGEGGEIFIKAGGSLSTGDLNTSSFSSSLSGNGGEINFATNGSISTGNLFSSSEANAYLASTPSTASSGQGGAIRLTSRDGYITTGLLRSVSYATSPFMSATSGDGGTIRLTADQGSITAPSTLDSSSGAFSEQDAVSGNGGEIVLAAGDRMTIGLPISGSVANAPINATSGNGSAIRLTANGDITAATFRSFSGSNFVAGNAGSVELTSLNGDISTEDILAYSRSSSLLAGNGGNVRLAAPKGSIEAFEIYSLSFSGSTSGLPTGGRGGTIDLTSGKDTQFMSLNSISWLGSGNITITSNGTVRGLVTGFPYIITSDTFGSGRGGDIRITTPSIVLSNGSQISASTHSSGQGGDITIQATNSVELTGTFQPIASAIPEFYLPGGIAGVPANTYLGGYIPSGNALQLFDLDFVNNTQFPSGVFTQTTVGSTGNAGTIQIETGRLTIQEGASIAATTFGSGNAGDILLNTAGTTTLDQKGSILSGVAAGSSGNSGKIAIQTQSLAIQTGGFIQTQTLGQGSAGTIQVNASDTINLEGADSAIRSGSGDGITPDNAIGKGGDIRLTTGNLQVTDEAALSAQTYTASEGGNIVVNASRFQANQGGQLRTTTSGNGKAGDIIINATDQVDLSDAGTGLFANTIGGPGGAIAVNTNRFQIARGAVLDATTTGANPAGNVTVRANTFNATEGGQLRTTTSGSGQAGDIALEVMNLTLAGSGTGLFASTASDSTGSGGNIRIDSQAIAIQDSARVAVDSQGTGEGGNIGIQTNSMLLNQQAAISAETVSNTGGNITLDVSDLLLLRRNSFISTTAGKAQGAGNGGNIDLSAGFIIAVPNENSDITANAYRGRGGNITITTQGIFGIEFRDRQTPLSDITASSRLGVNGVVTINTLGIDPVQGAVELPTTFSSPSLAQGCQARSSQTSSFVNTGRGGVPTNPTDPLIADTIWQDLELLREAGKRAREQPRTNNQQLKTNNPTSPIIEAQGWVVLSNGTIALTAEAPTVTPYGMESQGSGVFCQ